MHKVTLLISVSQAEGTSATQQPPEEEDVGPPAAPECTRFGNGEKAMCPAQACLLETVMMSGGADAGGSAFPESKQAWLKVDLVSSGPCLRVPWAWEL